MFYQELGKNVCLLGVSVCSYVVTFVIFGCPLSKPHFLIAPITFSLRDHTPGYSCGGGSVLLLKNPKGPDPPLPAQLWVGTLPLIWPVKPPVLETVSVSLSGLLLNRYRAFQINQLFSPIFYPIPFSG